MTKMASSNQVRLSFPSLLLAMAAPIVIVFSATVAAGKEMSCSEYYNTRRIEQSPPRAIDCNVVGESVGACVF